MIKKELLKQEKNTLKVLNGLFGYDFQKEYNLYKHDGKFTINSLIKKYDLDLKNNKVIILINDANCEYRKNKLFLVELEKNNKVNTEIRICESGLYSTNIDNFYAKYQFEEIRKKENIVTYIISQNINNLGGKYKRPAIDFDKRYKLISVNYHEFKNDYNKFSDESIDRINILDFSKENTYSNKMEYTTRLYYKENRITGIENVIDKSGYIVHKKRKDLEAKAKELRIEREKSEFLKADYTNELKRVRNIKEKLKSKIIEAYSNNNFTSDFFRKIKCIEFDIHWLLIDIEVFERGINKRKFNSIESVNIKFERIIDKYNAVIKDINNINKGE